MTSSRSRSDRSERIWANLCRTKVCPLQYMKPGREDPAEAEPPKRLAVNRREWLFSSPMVPALCPALERSYPGVRDALTTRVAHLIYPPVRLVDEDAALVRSTLDALRCPTPTARRATHMVVMRFDNYDGDYERTVCPIPDCRICLMSAAVERL